MGFWTNWHAVTILPTMAVSLVVAWLIGRAMRNVEKKKKYIPLQAIAVVLLVLEVVKQIVTFTTLGTEEKLYSLPFHFCSLFLYLFPIHAFYHGKHRRFVEAATLSVSASLFLFMLIMPTVVYSDADIQGFFTNYLDFHTVTFHALACFYFMLMVSLGLYHQDTKEDLKGFTIFILGYEVIATAMSYLLNTNFHNLLRCNLGAGEGLRQSLVASMGNWGQVIYTLAIFVGTLIFVSVAYFAMVYVIRLARWCVAKLTHKQPQKVEE